MQTRVDVFFSCVVPDFCDLKTVKLVAPNIYQKHCTISLFFHNGLWSTTNDITTFAQLLDVGHGPIFPFLYFGLLIASKRLTFLPLSLFVRLETLFLILVKTILTLECSEMISQVGHCMKGYNLVTSLADYHYFLCLYYYYY